MKSKTFKKRTKKPVGLIYDHINFHTKYNRKVLQNDIRKRCEEIIQNILDELRCKCVEVNAQPNHVHILVGIPLTITPSDVAQKVKSFSSYHLRKEFPILRKQIPKALWAPSSTHQSVGSDMIKVITFIKFQDKHHGGQKK
jgi:putative transposase